MEWLIRALTVLREIRDWAESPSIPLASRRALEEAASLVEAAVQEARDGTTSGEVRSAGITPLGPAEDVLTTAPAAKETVEHDTTQVREVAIAAPEAERTPEPLEAERTPGDGIAGELAPPAPPVEEADPVGLAAPSHGEGAGVPADPSPRNGATVEVRSTAGRAGEPERTALPAIRPELLDVAKRYRRPRPSEDRRMVAASPTDSPVQEISLDAIDPHALEVTRRLRRFGHRAYLVGGCVRDLLLGLRPKDFDIATSARPEEVKAIFRNSRIIGRRFRLVHVFFRGGKIIEVSTFRANANAEEDVEEGQDLLIRRDNVFGSEEEDARRRDFTINGLFYDIGTGRIIDHVAGLADVDKRLLRMIGDPEIRLREDPVRILRAIRIAAKANLGIDGELLSAIRRHKADISRCPPARVLEETLRLLRIGHSATTVRMMEETGVLEFLLPELHSYLEWPREEREPDGSFAANRLLPEVTSRGLMYRHLAALDAMIGRTAVSDAVVLGALLYSPVVDIQSEAEREERDKSRAVNEFLVTVGARLLLTRRLSEHLRQIFIAQRHFARPAAGKRPKRKGPAGTLARRAFFPDALDLYEIHVHAVGHERDELDRWRGRRTAGSSGSATGSEVDEVGGNGAGPEPLEADAGADREEGRRPRRRRGGRGRARPHAGGGPSEG